MTHILKLNDVIWKGRIQRKQIILYVIYKLIHTEFKTQEIFLSSLANLINKLMLCFYLFSEFANISCILTLLLLSTTCPVLANSADPDQLASEEANWPGSALFVIQYVNLYQQPGSSNLIGWKLEVGVAS